MIDMASPSALVHPNKWPRWMLVPSVARATAQIGQKPQALCSRIKLLRAGETKNKDRDVLLTKFSPDYRLAQEDFARSVLQDFKIYPEVMLSESGDLMRKCVDARNTRAVQDLVKAALMEKQFTPPILALRAYSSGGDTPSTSLLRRAAHHRDRLMIECLLNLYGETLKANALANQGHGYYCAVHTEWRPGPRKTH